MSLVRFRKQLYHTTDYSHFLSPLNRALYYSPLQMTTDYSHFLSPLNLVEKIVGINDDRLIHLRDAWFIHLHRAMCSSYNTLVYKNTRYLQ